MKSRPLLVAACAGLLGWHLLDILANGWVIAVNSPHGRDFASYYYAAVVAYDGGDPYDTAALGAAASAGARAGEFETA